MKRRITRPTLPGRLLPTSAQPLRCLVNPGTLRCGAGTRRRRRGGRGLQEGAARWARGARGDALRAEAQTVFQVSPVVFQIRDAGRLALTPRPRCLLCEVTVLPTLCGGGARPFGAPPSLLLLPGRGCGPYNRSHRMVSPARQARADRKGQTRRVGQRGVKHEVCCGSIATQPRGSVGGQRVRARWATPAPPAAAGSPAARSPPTPPTP